MSSRTLTASATPLTAGTLANQPARERLRSLDVYRGLTVMAMILVTDPGTYSAVYAPLSHAPWHGATPTDMIFPSFLFMSGASIPFAAAALAPFVQRVVRILRRSASLIALGLLLNAFPGFDLAHLRLPGILQRIGILYGASALLYQVLFANTDAAGSTRSRRTVTALSGLIVALLAGYWALLAFAPVPGLGAGHLDSYANFPAYVDRTVFSVQHLWAYGLTPGRGVTYDPEGLLSSLPAWTATLLGVLAGMALRGERSARTKVLGLLVGGAVLIVLAAALTPWMPVNKRIFTPTFALLSGGISLALLGGLYWLIDVRRMRRGLTLPLAFGTNAILAFTLSTLITSSLSAIHVSSADGSKTDVHTWLYQHLFTGWISPINGSLAYACTIVLINFALLIPFYRRRIFLRL